MKELDEKEKYHKVDWKTLDNESKKRLIKIQIGLIDEELKRLDKNESGWFCKDCGCISFLLTHEKMERKEECCICNKYTWHKRLDKRKKELENAFSKYNKEVIKYG